jgi:hypothetical protein
LGLYLFEQGEIEDRAMAKTRHIQKRMNQRGINDGILDIVKMFGVSDNRDKTILNRKGVQMALMEMSRIMKEMKKIESKGGIVLIEKDGSEITTYALDSYKKH